MPKPIEPEIVDPDDEGREDPGAKDRQKALAKLDALIKKIEENTRTNSHLIRLLEENRRTGGLSVPGPGKSTLDRVVDHALEAFPPDTLKDMVEGFLHEFARQGRKKRR